MKFSVVFYLVYFLPLISTVPQSTTPLPRPALSHLSVRNDKQLSKTAQIIKFVNSAYNDGGRSFIRRRGYDDLFSYKGPNSPLITTVGLNDENRWMGKLLDIFHANEEYGEGSIQKLGKNIRYYLIDNPEVLKRYQEKRVKDLRQQSKASFVSFGDYTGSSSLERERKHAIRRYVENFGFGEPETEVDLNDDMNTDDSQKIMSKALDNTEVSFQPSFPDEDDDKPFPDDVDLEINDPEKNEGKLEANNDENPIQLVKSTESEKIIPIMKKTEHRTFKGKNHNRDFNSDGFKKGLMLGSTLKQDEAWNKNDGDYKKPNKWEEETIPWVNNVNERSKKEYQSKFSEENSAEKVKESMDWNEGMDWKQNDEHQTNKDKKEDWDTKKKNWDGDDNMNKKDYAKKHKRYQHKNSKKIDKVYDWQKDFTLEKDKNSDNSKPAIERENEWDLRDKKRHKNRNQHELNSHNNNRDDNKSSKKENWIKKDKHRPDWDKKINNDNNKDITENDRYKKDDNWNKKDDWNKKHNKKSNEWDETDDRDKKDHRKKKGNDKDDRNIKVDDWEGDSRNKKNSDWNKKDNDWDNKNDRDRKDDDWNKDNERYQRNDDEKKGDWNKKNDGWTNSDGKHKKDDWDKKNDDWGKKENQEKREYFRNKKDHRISKEMDRHKKDSLTKKNKKFDVSDDEYKNGIEGNKNNDWTRYDAKNTYTSGERKKKINYDYNSYEKKPKKMNDWDNYVPKMANNYKPKKDSYERPHNPPLAFNAFGRTPIPFAGKKRIYDK